MSCFTRELPKFSDKKGSDRKVSCINLLGGLPIVGEYNIQYGFLLWLPTGGWFWQDWRLRRLVYVILYIRDFLNFWNRIYIFKVFEACFVLCFRYLRFVSHPCHRSGGSSFEGGGGRSFGSAGDGRNERDTPWKINMELENDGLEDDFPFQLGDF